jgi:hypothetical protein
MSSLATRKYSPIDSLAREITRRVCTVQAQHEHATGEPLDDATAITEWAALERATAAPGPIPAETLQKVRDYLEVHCYAPRAIRRVLDVIVRRGTTECGLEFLTEAQRKAIENLLPYAATYNDPRYDDFAGSRGRSGLAVRARAKDGVWVH